MMASFWLAPFVIGGEPAHGRYANDAADLGTGSLAAPLEPPSLDAFKPAEMGCAVALILWSCSRQCDGKSACSQKRLVPARLRAWNASRLTRW